MRKDAHQQFDWSGNIESLEQRLVMSADPLSGELGGQIQHQTILDDLPALDHHVVAEAPPALDHHLQPEADFWIDYSRLEAIEEELGQIEQSLVNANDQSGLTQVRNDYGFDGTGQTVAVIDSGIAYDHPALGGGFGPNYRVVGGWDFTGENDADPYDDGPSGSHGTHVAGIVGADGGANSGVAPGVDLVSLRVFDDAGNGYFNWVENALQWVHDNRNSFENPITAVNLSLGVASWNADTIPAWANLEEEFAQLEADGIFISVSAGNSFSTFNETGLSYPAASPYVIPVASVDDTGLMSYFSQRNSRVIAAPGRGIISTVPDYKGNNNGITDDYASFSGTSMAAPYVAGASVLIREAMEFVGYTNITQDTIYDQMIATADSFFDTATNQSYNRLNLESAIDALMPTDDYGSTLETAFNLGMVSSSSSMSGAITTLDDVDYFKFTAGSNGTVTFTASNMTYQVDANWEVTGGTSSWSGANNEILTVDVVAGQEYTVGFSSADGLGYYDLGITADSTFSYTDWGSISFAELQGVSVVGESWYRIAANAEGYFTTETMFDAGGGQISLELYDSQMQLIDSGNASGGVSRVDAYAAAAGEELFLKVTGTNSDIDFRLTNLVSLSGTTVNVAGTTNNDTFAFTAGNIHEISVNGTAYNFASIAISDINFNGGEGNDSISLTGTVGNETAIVQVNNATLNGTGFSVRGLAIENVVLNGGGGSDIVSLYDTAGDEIFSASPTSATLTGSGFAHEANDFFRINVYATAGGYDRAYLNGSAGNDTLSTAGNSTWFSSDAFVHYTTGFDRVDTNVSSGGYDRAFLNGTTGNDTLTAIENKAWFSGDGYLNYVAGFDRINTYAVDGGNDRAYLYDSAGDDVFTASPNGTWFSGNGFLLYSKGFDRVNAYSTAGGYDRAFLYDSAGDDILTATPTGVWFTSANYVSFASGFNQVHAYATAGGNDRAFLYDSAGNDIYTSNATRALLKGNSFYNAANGFEQSRAYSSGGYDRVEFESVLADEAVQGLGDLAQVVRSGTLQKTYGFDEVLAHISSAGSLDLDVEAIDYIFEYEWLA